MKNQPIRVLVAFALFASVGIFLVQGYWFREAFKAKKAEFDFQVFSGLKEIATELAEFNGIMLPTANPVEQVSNNYFVVMINDAINPSVLEALLLRNFQKMGLRADFQYGIYDCVTDQMVYSNRLNAFDQGEKQNNEVKEPEFINDNYYFSVYFPGIESVLIGSMGIWIFSSLILLLVIVFFAWAAIIILKQKRLSEIHTDFVNNLTHEMKTPLSSMKLALERISNIPETEKKSLSILQEEVDNLQSRINSILESVREGNKSEETHENIDLGDEVRSVLNKFPNEGINYAFEPGFRIIAHRSGMHSVITNLIDNAFKHGSPPIDISISQQKGKVALRIKDLGDGIPLRHRKKVFGKFYRVPKGNIYREKGFGLGLYLVKKIIKDHKGRILIDCPEQGGTIFTIYFNAA